MPPCPDGMYPVRAVCPSLIPLAGGSQAQSRTLLSSGGPPLNFPRGRRLFEEPPTSGRCVLMGVVTFTVCGALGGTCEYPLVPLTFGWIMGVLPSPSPRRRAAVP